MAEIRLECQGLPCPQPVLRCKEAIENEAPEELVIEVDNEAAKQNVSRFLASRGYEVHSVKQDKGVYVVSALAAQSESPEAACTVMSPKDMDAASSSRTVVFVPSDVVGAGNDELGTKLMQNLIPTLAELGPELWRIVLVNSGVRLSIQSSPVLESLQKLAANGVDVLVCGTCLEFFGLTQDKAVGETTNMLDIVTSFQLADKVIRI